MDDETIRVKFKLEDSSLEISGIPEEKIEKACQNLGGEVRGSVCIVPIGKLLERAKEGGKEEFCIEDVVKDAMEEE